MSLDIAILSEEGYPLDTVSLYPDQHSRIFGNLMERTYPLLSRMSDYYEDADFEVRELTDLKRELVMLHEVVQETNDKTVVSNLTKLVNIAIGQNRSVAALSD